MGLLCIYFTVTAAQWDTANVEMKVPSVWNQELLQVVPLKLGVDQNIAMHALPIARIFSLSNRYLPSLSKK